MSAETCCSVEKQSQVGAEMDILSSLLSDLNEAIDALGNRNHLILREHIPPPEETDKKDVVSLVPLASSLRSNNGYLRESISRIRDIISRIEV